MTSRASIVTGRAAVASAHPAASAAAADVLARGGTAADGAIAAQAVISVVLPPAAGLGGDLLALVHADDSVEAISGAGRVGRSPVLDTERGPGSAVTVPGLVDGWCTLHDRHGRLPLAEVLGAAIGHARDGITVDAGLAAAVEGQRQRLTDVSPESPLLDLELGALWKQPELAALLEDVAARGRTAYYDGPIAAALVREVRSRGGDLALADLADHRTEVGSAIGVGWAGGTLWVQPPPTQGVLLAMAAAWADRHGLPESPEARSHVLVELTEAAFQHRDDAALGAALLDVELDVDPERASGRGGPRAYLHTAGVAVSDGAGMTVSSLISVFDSFGSAVWVPEGGFVLNNRAEGFTEGRNSRSPGARPVHTLAPALLRDADGGVTAMSTPGADGQVQTILQVLCDVRFGGATWDAAVSAPRWRSQGGELIVESDHPHRSDLAARGHRIDAQPPGATIFGAMVVAGTTRTGAFAVADWRRQTSALARATM